MKLVVSSHKGRVGQYSVLIVGPFNQDKALVGAFSVIVKKDCETDGSSAALIFCLRLNILYNRYFSSGAAAAGLTQLRI